MDACLTCHGGYLSSEDSTYPYCSYSCRVEAELTAQHSKSAYPEVSYSWPVAPKPALPAPLPPAEKATNPKDAIGCDKLPLHLWPETATALGCLGLLDGALKYGRSNFRVIGVRASIYYDAARRHLNAWFEGEDIDPDSGLPHLAHALATIAIVIDAQAAGKLNDDRMTPGGYRALVNDLTPHVVRLKEKHADKAPKHYSITDKAEKE